MQRVTDAKEVILTSDATGESWSAAVWDPRNGSLLSVYKNATALGYRGLQLLSDCYVLGADATRPRIHVWSLNNPSPLHIRLTTPGKVTALACTPSGSYLIAAVGESLFVWQTCNGKRLANLTRHYQTVNCLATTKDGSLFASASEDGLVFVWSLYSVLNDAPCTPVHEFAHHSLPVKDLHLGHGDARARLYTVSLDRTANVYELGSGALLVSLRFDAPLTAVTVNVRESELFVGCTTGEIFRCYLHEPPRSVEHIVNSGGVDTESAAFQGHRSDVTALSVSVDCRTLLSGSTDGTVHVWDIASRQVLRTLPHKGPVTAAFFARGYDNFRATVLRLRLQIRSLQGPSDDDVRESVEVVSRGRDPAEILNYELYAEGSGEARGSDEKTSKKVEDLQNEIKKLKKINAAIYQYSVTHILNKIVDD